MLSTAPPAAAARLVTVDVATGARTVLADTPRVAFLSGPCWAADGAAVVLEQRASGAGYAAYRPARQLLARTASANGAIFAPGCARVAELRRRLPRSRASGVLLRETSGPTLAALPAYWPLESPLLSWSPDAGRIADVDDSGRRDAVRVTDAATGRELARARATRDAILLFAGAFAPGGASVVFVDSALTRPRADVRLLDVATGAVRTLAALRPQSHAPWVTWSPSGDRLAVVLEDRLHLFDVDGRDLGIVAPGQDVYEVVWSPDGARLAFTAVGRRRTTVHVVDAVVGAKARRLAAVARPLAGPPSWSPDGARLALATQR